MFVPTKFVQLLLIFDFIMSLLIFDFFTMKARINPEGIDAKNGLRDTKKILITPDLEIKQYTLRIEKLTLISPEQRSGGLQFILE